jgi:hypothetical protein
LERKFSIFLVGCKKNTDQFQANGHMYPTWFSMVMDYLPIQASSVPSERVFSSAAETDTKWCNRMGPVLMEALQMLKFHYKKQRLNFTTGYMFKEEDLELDKYVEDRTDTLGSVLNAEKGEDWDEILKLCHSDDELQ